MQAAGRGHPVRAGNPPRAAASAVFRGTGLGPAAAAAGMMMLCAAAVFALTGDWSGLQIYGPRGDGGGIWYMEEGEHKALSRHIDTVPPTINISYPPSGMTFPSDVEVITARGNASDNSKLEFIEIYLNGAIIRRLPGKEDWKCEIYVERGPNIILSLIHI